MDKQDRKNSENDGIEPQSEPNELEQKDAIRQLENKIAELKAGWQRTQADFVNFKRQTEQERSRLIRMASADIIEALLPILDNFVLAAKHLPKELENNSWAEGINQIEKQLETVLSSEGLERINTAGQQFNPEIHEACEEVESNEPEGQILEELSPGYTFHGIVLRPAKVKVSKSK